VDISADCAGLKAGQQVFGLRLNNHAMANEVQRLLFRGTLPAILGGTLFGLNDGIKRLLLGPGGDALICPGKISLGDLQIQLWLTDGFIAGVEKGFGLGTVLGAQAFLLAGFRVFDVEHAANLAAVKDETLFHSSDFFRPRL